MYDQEKLGKKVEQSKAQSYSSKCILANNSWINIDSLLVLEEKKFHETVMIWFVS